MLPEERPVQFDEDNSLNNYKRHFIGGDPADGGFVMKIVLKSGLVKNKNQANYLLTFIALLFFGLAILVIVKM